MGLRTGISINVGIGIGSGGGVPGGDSGPLLTFTEGSFSRAGEGLYLTDADSVAVATTDVLRLENRGGAEGAVPLFLAAVENLLARSQETATAPWTPTSATNTADAATDPEGIATNADQVAFTASANARDNQTVTAATIPSSTTVTLSVWARGATGTGEAHRFQLQDKSAVLQSSGNFALTTTWTRQDFTTNSGAGAGNAIFRLMNSTAALVHTSYFWGAQLQRGSYPTQVVRTVGARATSAEDVLQFLAAQVPLQLREGATTVKVYPYYANTDLVSGDVRVIYSFGDASNLLRIRHDGANVLLEAVVGGSVVAESDPLTFARHAELDIAIDPVAGELTVNTVTGPSGTPWVWPGGVQMRVGGIVGGVTSFDGRIAEPEAA